MYFKHIVCYIVIKEKEEKKMQSLHDFMET